MNKKHVSLEIAILLKEKGFDIPQLYFYIDGDLSWKVDNTRCTNKIEGEYSAPTIVEVIDWLYEKHGIWVQCMIHHRNPNDFVGGVYFKKIKSYFTEPFDEPTEAYEAAIKYCLTELIK